MRSTEALTIPCSALLFDMDGVLVDSRAVVERTWRRWAQRHRLDPEPLLRVAHGRRTRDTLHAVLPHFDPDLEVPWLDAAELEDYEGLVAVPGARELVAALPPDRWAVVTSAGRDLARRRLLCAGLPVPDVLVTSDDVARGKPAPDGYLLAAERLRTVASGCVVFEDAPPGVAAGRAAGARVIAIATTHPVEQLGDALAVIADLAGVRIGREGSDLRLRLSPGT